MRKYEVALINEKTYKRELLEFWEMQRRAFTKREYDMILTGLFFWASSSCVYENVVAEVKQDGAKVLEVRCRTEQDGDRIIALVTINGNLVRSMGIAC